MKIIFLIIAGGGQSHESHEIAQRETWASIIYEEVEILWLRGGSPFGTFLSQDTLFVPCEEKYENLLEKTIHGINWLIENRTFDILIRSNTSNYFSLKKLLQYSYKLKVLEVGGQFETTRRNFVYIKKGYRYLNGSAIFLGQKACHSLVQMNTNEYIDIPDDLAIHHFLESQGFKFYKIPRNNLGTHHIFFPFFQVRVKSWNNDALTSARMQKVHEYFCSTSGFARLGAWFKVQRLEWEYAEISLRNLLKLIQRYLLFLLRR